MKVLIISDASSVGTKDASALAEIRHALESEAHDVDIVRVDPTLSDDFAAKAAALLSGADVVVFGNGDQTSKGFVEKMLMLSDGVQAERDALTHIMNRRGYEQDWPQFMLDHPTFILISVDINDFKLFNDLFGHHIGDQLLVSLANEFRALIPKDALVARSGGDEFVLLVPGPDEAWMQEADGFFNSTHSFEFEGMTYTYMLSGGFAAYPEQTDSFATLTRMADSALYHAKMLAKDKFFKYTPEMENDFRVTLGFNARSLAATAPGAMLVFKSEGDHEILFANDLCAELFGYPPVAEFLGANQGLSCLVCPEDRDRFDRSLTEQAAHPDARRQSSATYRLMSRDGSVRTVLAVERMSENDRFGRVFHAVFFDPETIGEGLGFIGD